MKNKLLIIIALLFLNGFESPSILLAQVSDSTATINKDSIKVETAKQFADTIYLPSRGNLVFTSVSPVEDPFVSTKFLLGFGIAEIIKTKIPITIGEIDTTIEIEPDVFYTTGGMEFQFAIRDWTAVKVKASGVARLGNNFFSLASEGVSAGTCFDIGWLFRIIENEDLMFSGAITLNTFDLTYIDLIGSKDTTITSVDTLITREVIKNYQSLTSEADLRFAMKFSNVFGMLAKFSADLGQVYVTENKSSFQYNFGLAFSIDLRNWIGIPFGIGLGGSIFSNDWRFDSSKPPIYSANLNIAFYNRNDFTIGVENYIQIIEPQQYDLSFTYANTKIYMSYYF